MKEKGLASLLVLMIFVANAVSVKATISPTNEIKSPLDESLVQENIVSGLQPSAADWNDSTGFVFFRSDSNLKNVGFLNYRFQPDYPLDSSDLKDVLNYLKKVLPAIQQMANQEIEMIEIL
jgi:hypothetical protein